MEFFTKSTYLELIPILTPDQLNRECNRHLKAAKQGGSSQKSVAGKQQYLMKRAEKLTDGVQVQCVIESAIADSCDRIINQIEVDLMENKNLICEFQKKIDSFGENQNIRGISEGIITIQEKITEILEDGVPTYINLCDVAGNPVSELQEAVADFKDKKVNSFCTDGMTQTYIMGSDIKHKNVLVLSDSRNLQFEGKKFRNIFGANTSCTIKPMFHIRHINNFVEDISNSDIVLVSCGVNDIIKWESNGTEVANYFISFTEQMKIKFPHVRFLFNSVLPTTVQVRKNLDYIKHIDLLNLCIFNHTLSSSNVKSFDNVRFEWSHLSRDGIHLTPEGRAMVSSSWCNAVNLTLGFDSKPGSLPIRPLYVAIYNRFITYFSK